MSDALREPLRGLPWPYEPAEMEAINNLLGNEKLSWYSGRVIFAARRFILQLLLRRRKLFTKPNVPEEISAIAGAVSNLQSALAAASQETRAHLEKYREGKSYDLIVAPTTFCSIKLDLDHFANNYHLALSKRIEISERRGRPKSKIHRNLIIGMADIYAASHKDQPPTRGFWPFFAAVSEPLPETALDRKSWESYLRPNKAPEK